VKRYEDDISKLLLTKDDRIQQKLATQMVLGDDGKPIVQDVD
jgi:hypothetical protein